MTDIDDIGWPDPERDLSVHRVEHDPSAPAALLRLPADRRRRVAALLLREQAHRIGAADPPVLAALDVLADGALPDSGDVAEQLASWADVVGDAFERVDEGIGARAPDAAGRAALDQVVPLYRFACGIWYLAFPRRSTVPEVTAVMEAHALDSPEQLDALVDRAIRA